MKDIFEILQHENHELELIKYNNENILGCKTCGKTLLTETYIKEHIEEYSSIMDTLSNRQNIDYQERTILSNCVRILGRRMLDLNDNAIEYMINKIRKALNDRMKTDYLSEHEKLHVEFSIEDLAVQTYRDPNICNIDRATKLIEICYKDKEEKMQFLVALKNKVLKVLKEKCPEYNFYDSNKTVTAGYKTYKIDRISDKQYRFFALHKESLKELNEKYPTPTEKYTFKDIKDFYSKQPDWDDEENREIEYYEYLYRIENDLYDYSNIAEGVDILIKDAIEVFENYESVERFIIPLKKTLKERYNIEL